MDLIPPLYTHGCDVFLLERWDPDSPQSPDEQMMRLFAQFLELPFSERQAFAQQVRDRNISLVAELGQADQDVLALARPRDERNPGDTIWLRTYYGPGSDDALAAILATYNGGFPVGGMGVPGTDCLFSDVTRYDFGNDWQRVFGRMPQLLEYPCHAGDYEADRAAALQEGQVWEREGRERVEEDDQPPEALYIGDLYNYYHIVAKLRLMYVLDETTLAGDNKAAEARQLLAIWHDPDGRIVRLCRMSADDVYKHTAVLNSGSIDDFPTWMDAEVGDDYNWDGILGPPLKAEDEDGDSEEGSDEDEDGDGEEGSDEDEDEGRASG